MRKRTNEEWLRELNADGYVQEKALSDLHKIILTGLPYALSKWLSPNDPKFSAFIEEVAQDTLLRVMDKLNTFEGRSQLTTWVHKIAIRIALTELRRQRWREVSLNEITAGESGFLTPSVLADSKPGPESNTEQQDMIVQIQRIINEELTQKQRQAIIAISIKGIPVDVVAKKMNMKRNALYKLMHDARLRLRQRMSLEGLTLDDVLSTFE